MPPLPEPFSDETQEVFMDRCMNDDTAIEDFPRGDQRLAVCLQQWEDVNGSNEEEDKMHKDKIKQLENDNEVKKKITFEVKAIGDESERITRWTASTETPDRDDDIIRVAGWELDNFNNNPVILFMHNNFMPPIGKAVNVIKDVVAKKLIIDIKHPTIEELSTDVRNPHQHALFCDMIYNMAKNGYIGTGSVGFRSSEFQRRTDQGDVPEWERGIEFMKQELLEFSITTVPANPEALMTASNGAKAMGKDELTKAMDYAKTFIELEDKPADGLLKFESYMIEDDEAEKLYQSAKALAEELGIEAKRIVVDGKESQVTIRDGEEKGVTVSISYFDENKGQLHIDSKYIKQQSIEGEKILDPMGNPSARDIEFAIDDHLYDTLNSRRLGWSIDVWPISYPSGNVSVRWFEEEKTMLHPYTYTSNEDGEVTIQLGEGSEVELVLDFKALEARKAGAELSTKNISLIQQSLEHINQSITILNGMVTVPTESTDGEMDDDDDKSLDGDQDQHKSINDDTDENSEHLYVVYLTEEE